MRIVARLSQGIFLFLATSLHGGSSDLDEASVILTVCGVESPRGTVIAAFFACEQSYESNDDPRWHAAIAIKNRGQVVYVFEEIPAGRYAIKLFHDVNDNQKLDTNWLGIPREPYGFSNNPRIRFGPPSFDTAAFVVEEGTELALRIILN